MVQSKLTRNKVDVCDHTKDVKAPKEVGNDQHFVEGSLPVRYPNETGSPVQSFIKNTYLNQTDTNKANGSHEKIYDIYDSRERSHDDIDSTVQSSIKNTDSKRTDANKVDGSHEIPRN